MEVFEITGYVLVLGFIPHHSTTQKTARTGLDEATGVRVGHGGGIVK